MKVQDYVKQAFAAALKEAGVTINSETVRVTRSGACGHYECAWDDMHHVVPDAATGSYYGSARGGVVRLVSYFSVELQHRVYPHSWHRFRGVKGGVPAHTIEETY